MITKIVLTGGPCAGKTTSMGWIQNEFDKMGYKVLFVPETATELITSGISPAGYDLVDFQRANIILQKAKEKVFEEAAKKMPDDKILIVCDRGVMDIKAYVTPEQWDSILSELGTNEIDERDHYDAVFHLTTAANGAEEFYTLENNTARTETPDQARELDNKIISAWTGHPHLRVVDNSDGDFKLKLQRLMKEIASFLGEPEPLEIERKYLIEYPDIEMLESLPNCDKVEIIQTYLNSKEGDEIRVRQRGKDGHYVFFRTEKRRVSEDARVEIERMLTEREYLSLLMEQDPARKPIRKTRYLLTENSRYYEIDVYPMWKNQAIMELELSSEDEEIILPDKIKVIKDVTEDPAYSNYQLALV